LIARFSEGQRSHRLVQRLLNSFEVHPSLITLDLPFAREFLQYTLSDAYLLDEVSNALLSAHACPGFSVFLQ
jgi:hypothetical protein